MSSARIFSVPRFRPFRGACFVWLSTLISGLAGPTLMAHQVSSVSLIASFETGKARYELDAAMEVIPSEEDALNETISPEDAAREFATEYLTILFDEEEVTPEMSISIERTSDEQTPEELQREQVIVNLTGAIPPGREEFLLYLDPSCPMAVVMVVVKDERPARRMQVVLAGEYSRPVNILPVIEEDPFHLPEAGKAKGGEEKEASPDPSGETVAADSGAGFAAVLAGGRAFFSVSPIPMLFVLSLFLLSPRRKPVFLSVAGFLIGLSLSISLRGWKLMPEVGMAVAVAGILLAALGIEALVHGTFRWWRVGLFALAGFGSGLILAASGPFRAALSAASDAESFPGVIAFLFGAELAAVAGGFLAGLFLRSLYRFSWYQKSVVQPLAVVVTGVGLYFLVNGWI